MDKVLLPKKIEFGENALSEAEYPKNALVVTTAPPALSDKWLDKWELKIICYLIKLHQSHQLMMLML